MSAPGDLEVGFAGLGNMGWPMARHLSTAGVGLTVHDRDIDKARAFAREVGGRVAEDPVALARAAPVVITMLPDSAEVRSLTLGQGGPGLVDGIGRGAVLVDMGSSDPSIYPEIEAALAARGAQLIDAPVSGAVTGARAGTLTIMAGGEPAVIERLTPLFRLMGERVFATGGLGTGQAMKALNNLASAGAFLLSLEILMIGQRHGLDPAQMTRILNVSTGRNNATDKKILPHVLSRSFDSGFALALMAKDLTTAGALARITRTPTVLAEPMVEAAKAALEALGPTADHTELARWLEGRVGEELRSKSPSPEVGGGDAS